MQLKYLATVQQPTDGMQKIAAMSWSPNGKRFAVALADKVVHLYDQDGSHKDKFSTKPAEKGQKSYTIRGMQFSPDNDKVAIAQSDNIVFVYKIGLSPEDKKSIINKYQQTSSVTCLVWPKSIMNEIFFGLAEGKVKRGFIKKQYKSSTICDTKSYVVSLAASPDGLSLLSGHLDNTVIKINIEKGEFSQIITHSSIPYALDWGSTIGVGGNDGKVAFYEANGNVVSKFDYSMDEKVKEFTCASASPSGDAMLMGNFNRFYLYTFNNKRGKWDETSCKVIENYYTVSCITWKPDGTKFITGSLCGSVDMFDVCMKKSHYKGFEVSYISASQILIKSVETNESINIKSNSEINKFNIYRERYIIAHTADSLILGDITEKKTSEIQWRGSGNEKFDLSNPGVCMIFNAGELTLVEYGKNEIMGTCRTEYLNPHLISARIRKEESLRIIAFLFDEKTIRIQDLTSSVNLATIDHDWPVDFLDLNLSGSKLLFRDKHQQLILYNIKEQKKETLLSYCKYASWVPSSDVVVAQGKSFLSVWYNIEETQNVTQYQIKGNVDTIERANGKTEVIVDSGANSLTYELNESLINFCTEIETRNFEKAIKILENAEKSPEIEANWRRLAKMSFESNQMIIAERCYSYLGDVAKARYLHIINKHMKKYEAETKSPGINYHLVQAMICMIKKEFTKAETILLNHNDVDEAMAMYQDLHRWDDSLRIAEKKNHEQVGEFKKHYYEWLIESKQEGKAAELKEREGDYIEAIRLYLQGSLPSKAANIVYTTSAEFDQNLLEKIATSLLNSNMHEKAGDFYEKMEIYERALDVFVKGNCFHKAVDLAKREFPKHVLQLEEEWGDWLVQQKQYETAINHYIQAGVFSKGIDAAINSKQWGKAIQTLTNQPPEVSRPFYKVIARHYADVRQLDIAEKYYLKAGEYVEAFEMYIKCNKWEQAFKIISKNVPESEVVMIYIKEGQKLEKEGKYKEAEKMYITANEPDLAINMYKKAKQFDNMIKLVAKYRKDHLKDYHLHLAKNFEMENNLKQAEHHFIEANSMQGAVDMYRSRDMWEEAIRVSRAYGTSKEVGEIAKKWASTMDKDEGIKMLLKLGLVEAAVDLEADRKNFENAFKLANDNAKYKLPEIYLKMGLYLEDEHRYKEAEDAYIRANKPSEAIMMYQHLEDWHSALQIARQIYPEGVQSVYIAQGQSYLKKKDFPKAEQAFINAKKYEIIINAYLQNQMWNDAMRVAQKYVPNIAQELNKQYSSQVSTTANTLEELLASAKMWMESGNYDKAIDVYLQINTKHCSNLDNLEKIWENAVLISNEHDKARNKDITIEVANRLREIKRYSQSAELYESAGFYEYAVDAYIEGECWEAARNLATQLKQQNVLTNLFDKVEDCHRKFLIQKGDIKGAIDEGDVKNGLDMYADKEQWEECLDLALKQGVDVFAVYCTRFANKLYKEGQFKELAEVFIHYKVPVEENLLQFYKKVSVEILLGGIDAEMKSLSVMLKLLDANYQNKEFQNYLLISHLQLLKSNCMNLGFNKIYCRICINLLRYIKEIRPDKAFYEAGLACRNEKITNLSFVFYNLFLDLADAIDDPNSGIGDNQHLEETDIPSLFDIILPDKNYISEDKRSEIKDWILSVSVEKKGNLALPTKPCERCGAKLYEYSQTCKKCSYEWDTCIVTGSPLYSSVPVVKCKFCSKSAIKEYWNEYVQKVQHCPWCENVQTIY